MMISHRSFASEEDYGRMRRLLVEALGQGGLPVYATIGDIDWWRAADEDPRAVYMAHLWLADGHPVAWAWPVDDQVDIVVNQEYPFLFGEVLAWAEQEYLQRQGDFPANPMRAWAFTQDSLRIATLEERGYHRTENGLVFYTSRTQETPDASLPSGYRFDHVRGEADVERRTSVQRAAFESTFMTTDKTRALQALPTYRADLDLVVVAPDDTYAAFAQIWLDEENGVGVFEPLGVAAGHRRRGLGQALLSEGRRRLRQLGATVACVQTGIANTRAQALYEAAGFVELDRNMAWIRAPNPTESPLPSPDPFN